VDFWLANAITVAAVRRHSRAWLDRAAHAVGPKAVEIFIFGAVMAAVSRWSVRCGLPSSRTARTTSYRSSSFASDPIAITVSVAESPLRARDATE
jgi:hypothetical protein